MVEEDSPPESNGLLPNGTQSKEKYNYILNMSSTSREDVPLRSEETPPASFTTTQKQLLAGLALANILNGSLVAVMIPFFPVEAASRGVPQTTISALFSCFAIGQMVLSPVIGRLAPVLGVTRLYNIGISVAGLSTLVFGSLYHITDTDLFVAACFLTRLVESAGMAAVTTCGYTIAGSQFPGRVNTAVAWLGSSLTAGLALTPVFWGGLYAVGGFGTPFYTLGVVMLVVAAFNSWLMPAVEEESNRRQPRFLGTLLVFLSSTDNLICMATVFMFSTDFSTVDASIAPYADAVLGITPAMIGLYLFVSTSLYVVANFFWGWLAERSRLPFALIAPCLLFSSLGLLLLAPSPLLGLEPSKWLLGLGLSVEEVFFGGAFTPCYKVMLDASIARGLDDSLTTQAFVSSMLQTMYTMGVAVGPVSGGALIDAYGFPVMTTVLAFITMVVGLLVTVKAFVRHGCCRDAALAASNNCAPWKRRCNYESIGVKS
ncbi:MFS-type transporter SLC18B1 [Amphibalanus amphitrite]|uniref:MFS-type transporter SLC18B1 n=1 Tax=Amphibalanus amphitrite TaxID=1232801 RepID=A0A6A4VCH6_AMPAM|nr:MFS-type transporter SLC18B1 [Amphibalanus amphitrite]